MQCFLFICTGNRLRSPTAEHIFARYPNLETRSAGLAHDAVDPLTPEHFDGVDTIFVMEKAQRSKLTKGFKRFIGNARVICLNIPDDYSYMQPELIALLQTRVAPHIR